MDTLIELRNVGKWYAAGRPVLHGIDLEVRRGQVPAIRGRNGSVVVQDQVTDGNRTILFPFYLPHQVTAGRIANRLKLVRR